MLELAQNRVVVVNQPEAHKPGKIFPLAGRQAPPTGRSHDVIDEREMFEEQPLIVHADLDGNPLDYRYASPTTQGR